jgi:hypothetical protein
MASRRDSYNDLLWQTPVLSLTAQAFLLTIALGSGTSHQARIVSGFLALITALASVQLFARHRAFEVAATRWLKEFEIKNRARGYDCVSIRVNYFKGCSFIHRLLSLPSYRVWIWALLSFAISSALIIIAVVTQRFGLLPNNLFDPA